MRKHTKSKYKGDGDFEGLLDRLLQRGKYGYKGKQKSLINSFIFFTENHPRHGRFFTRKTYLERAADLEFRILESNQYPRNYIRAKDRYGMLDVIDLFIKF
jgi:hypothetical protein